MGRTRCCATASLALLTALVPLESEAAASPLRRIASDVGAFASDGARYVAWEPARPRGARHVAHSPIVVLDTGSGRTFRVPTDCSLEDRAPAAAGRFLVACVPGGQALLDVRKRLVTPLPSQQSVRWMGVGLRYAVGRVEGAGSCRPFKAHEPCTALYEIATGVVSEAPATLVPDPDRAGAPALCRRLRHRVFARDDYESIEHGLGPLAPLGAGFSYRAGVFAHLEPNGEAPPKDIRIERCQGATTVIAVQPEHGEASPWNLQLGADRLTWDTGLAADRATALETIEHPRAARHGTLTSYTINPHRLRTWRLPVLRLRQIGIEEREWPIGNFGYSAHAGDAVFWIAAREENCESEKGGCNEPGGFDIYAAGP